jgi:hypothetical protein
MTLPRIRKILSDIDLLEAELRPPQRYSVLFRTGTEGLKNHKSAAGHRANIVVHTLYEARRKDNGKRMR